MLKASVFISALMMMACGSRIDELSSKRESSNIGTTENAGVVSGSFSSSASVDQKMVASPSSKAADSSITVPPGALAVNADIVMGEAADQSTAILAEMAVTTALKAGDPVFAAGDNTNPPELAKPLTIQLPLPLDQLQEPNGSTGLADSASSKLVLIYLIYKEGSWKRGMIPLTKANLLGAFLKQELQGFGYFQIVYLALAASEIKEGASLLSPTLKGK